MKLMGTSIFGLVVLTISFVSVADEYKTVKFGDAEVVYNYRPLEEGVATLTLTSLIYENNDSLRGIKNTEQRRLSKLGQLIYQCKLLLYKPDKSDSIVNSKDPILISKNYSLFTDVNFQLAIDEGVGIQVQSLQVVDDKSLFTPTLGTHDSKKGVQKYLGEGEAINLKHLSLNVLQGTDLLESAETVEVNVRFPAFQLEKPVHQWSYSFNAKDFKQAIQYTYQNCTLEKLMDLVNPKD